MLTVHKTLVFAAASAWACAVWADGLKVQADDDTWARWQGRLSLGAAAPAWRASLGELGPAGLRVNSVSLSGDYYFTGSLFDRSILGGLRATSGLIVGPRTLATAGQPAFGAQGSGFAVERRLLGAYAQSAIVEPASDVASLPYLGLGYTGLSARGKWSFSADVGLLALSPGNVVRFGRVVGGTQSLDDVLRDLRLAPLLQMGVSYSF
jgi:hypothetical protein